MKALYQKIRSLQGKPYGNYKTLSANSWQYGDFSLDFLHIQGDPFAPASRVMVKASLSTLGFGSEWSSSFERCLALSDFLLRELAKNVQQQFPEKDPIIALPMPGPEMLVRNSLWVDNGELRVCLQVRLPGEGRKIQSDVAAEILTMTLPDVLASSLYCKPERMPALEEHYQVLANRKAILDELKARGLVAFVPNGAVLPRASGLSQAPLASAVPFVSPAALSVTFNVNGQEITGMGIPQGITVISGGAFHGKSTLLSALVQSVYPHIPGDGREGIVVDESAVRVCVEEGRFIRGTNLSPLVRILPGNVSTKNFCTQSASGSTSEVANLLEAMEAGARIFFIDEDSSAVNFLIRGKRVRELLGEGNEPLIPLTDRIQEFAKCGCSFILVAGACGDFLDIADNIIVMSNYKAESVLDWKPSKESATNNNEPLPAFSMPKCRSLQDYIQPCLPSLRPTSSVERQVKVKLNGDALLQIGYLLSDTSKAGLLVDKFQRLGAGYLLLNLCQNAASNGGQDDSASIIESALSLVEKIKNVGFRNLPQGLSREMSLPRPIDVACVLFRLNEYKR